MKIQSFEQPVQLMFVPEKRVVVEFSEGLSGKPKFSKEYAHLEKAMDLVGIPIPILDRPLFSHLRPNQTVVKLNDPDFGRAFYEIYFKTKMDPGNFDWEGLK